MLGETLHVILEPIIKSRTKKGDVEIIEYYPDYDNLAWTVLMRLGAPGESPGNEALIVAVAFECLKANDAHGTAYHNPRFTVRAPSHSKTFSKTVEWARKTWIAVLKANVGRGFEHVDLPSETLSRRLQRNYEGIVRRLQVSGVLFIDGRHVPTGQLPRPPKRQEPSKNLVGQRFGRLSVVRMLPKAMCECTCSCDCKTVVVRRSHLLSGGKTSCGCRAKEIQAKQQAMKETRMQRYNTGGDFLRAVRRNMGQGQEPPSAQR